MDQKEQDKLMKLYEEKAAEYKKLQKAAKDVDKLYKKAVEDAEEIGDDGN
jgi:hypothetical protein